MMGLIGCSGGCPEDTKSAPLWLLVVSFSNWWEVWGSSFVDLIHLLHGLMVEVLQQSIHHWGQGVWFFFPMPFSVGKNDPHWCQELTKMRTEMLGTAYTAQHSDCRVLEQLHLGSILSPNVLGKHLAGGFVCFTFCFIIGAPFINPYYLAEMTLISVSSFSCSQHWKRLYKWDHSRQIIAEALVPRSVGELLKYAKGMPVPVTMTTRIIAFLFVDPMNLTLIFHCFWGGGASHAIQCICHDMFRRFSGQIPSWIEVPYYVRLLRRLFRWLAALCNDSCGFDIVYSRCMPPFHHQPATKINNTNTNTPTPNRNISQHMLFMCTTTTTTTTTAAAAAARHRHHFCCNFEERLAPHPRRAETRCAAFAGWFLWGRSLTPQNFWKWAHEYGKRKS